MRKKKRKTNQIICKEKLIELYLVKEYSISMIENELDIPRCRIEKLFKEYGINKKTQEEIQKSKLIRDKIHKTVNEKYGGFTLQSAELKEKVKNTNLKKYGVENVYQSDKIKSKIKISKKQKYGNENYNNIEKAKKTFLEKYGVDNPSKSEEIKNKKINNSLKKYGVEYPSQLKEIKEKVKNTMLHKYGVKNGLLLNISIKRAKEKMKEIYNVLHGFQSLDIQKKIHKNLYNVKKYSFPSGRITYVMGYENIMIDLLLKNGISENDILTNYDCPIID